MKVEQTNFVTHLIITAVLDPDLEIRLGGGGGAHPVPYIRGAVSKKFFSALLASVWSKNRGGGGPSGPSPGSATVQYNYIIEYLRTRLLKSNGND